MRPIDLALSLVLVLITGCSAARFPEAEFVALENVRTEDVLEDARVLLSQRFTVLNSVVFKKYGKSISVLGYTRVDEPGNSITVAVLSPAGVKLCEASDAGGREEVRYVAAPLDELGDVAGVVLRDIRRMYFDRLPAAGAACERKADRLLFSEKVGTNRVQYVLAGAPVLPVYKEVRVGRRMSWSVSYSDHRRQGSRVFPGRMVLRDHEQNYELLVRLVEIVSEDTLGN